MRNKEATRGRKHCSQTSWSAEVNLSRNYNCRSGAGGSLEKPETDPASACCSAACTSFTVHAPHCSHPFAVPHCSLPLMFMFLTVYCPSVFTSLSVYPPHCSPLFTASHCSQLPPHSRCSVLAQQPHQVRTVVPVSEPRHVGSLHDRGVPAELTWSRACARLGSS